jgi:hypothetical protein
MTRWCDSLIEALTDFDIEYTRGERAIVPSLQGSVTSPERRTDGTTERGTSERGRWRAIESLYETVGIVWIERLRERRRMCERERRRTERERGSEKERERERHTGKLIWGQSVGARRRGEGQKKKVHTGRRATSSDGRRGARSAEWETTTED